MDLVTLVAACALTVDPKVMHALIWHQSGGEPWSFSVLGENQPQVYSTMRKAIREARAATTLDGDSIRAGLTGLSVDPRLLTAIVFSPCPNIAIAGRQIAQLVDRCKTLPHFKADPTYCAIAVYRGSWERPDNKFADAVRTSVAKGDAPDFAMPKGAHIDSIAVASDIPVPGLHPPFIVSPAPPDDLQQAWSSALFPSTARQFDRASSNTPMSNPDAERLQVRDSGRTHRTTAKSPAESLFVRRSPERRSQ